MTEVQPWVRQLFCLLGVVCFVMMLATLVAGDGSRSHHYFSRWLSTILDGGGGSSAPGWGG